MVTGGYCISIYSDLAALSLTLFQQHSLRVTSSARGVRLAYRPQSVGNKVSDISRVLHILKIVGF